MLSTAALTVTATWMGLAACLVVVIAAIRRSQTTQALAWAGMAALIVHLAVLAFGESAVADYCWRSDDSEPFLQWPALAGFPTWYYNLPAWLGLVLLGAAATLATIKWLRD